MTDFVPEDVPIRPAATVMLIDDRPDLQVFMMERHANTVFAGGMWVFPGGAVDHQDDASYYAKIATHRTDAEASALMGLESGGLAYYMAAIRETFEEAGILLALHRHDERPLRLNSSNQQRFESLRDQLNAGDTSLKSILQQESLLADVGQMHYVARWITPLGSPRRFDARFFIACIPSEQIPIHDDGELVNSTWMSPQDILERAEQEEMVLMSPTLRMVKNLAAFQSAPQVIESVEKNPLDEQARVHRDTGIIVMPGEAGYDDALTDVENGWVRLKPQV
ncbi:MAG: NUDIX hydrolase [Pseudomonadales bacterium]|nr:NUDIX hydrolase [Pseudomonadales bacterium]MBO6566264.1 NUDIX hydrolase [Pseudomonadales bacterium]MBO6594556.1 NUDIX hydrolase [Pseudomonadales bacterium]MBO6655509.1 NUDIX hydrolase [Pseudomonadales bacterium]MBO6821883.1 NUDIX hydrolase [Pseudomonadales bacterium]